MQPTTIFAILAAASFAMAAPSYGKHPGSGSGSGSGLDGWKMCNNNQKQACCDGIEGDGLLGSQCTLLSVLGGACGGGNVQCCEIDNTGAISLISLCVPISL